MNSTPVNCAAIMRLTALPPPPPSPMTLILAACGGSSELEERAPCRDPSPSVLLLVFAGRRGASPARVSGCRPASNSGGCRPSSARLEEFTEHPVTSRVEQRPVARVGGGAPPAGRAGAVERQADARSRRSGSAPRRPARRPRSASRGARAGRRSASASSGTPSMIEVPPVTTTPAVAASWKPARAPAPAPPA